MKIKEIVKDSEVLYSFDEIKSAISNIADEINKNFEGVNDSVTVLPVMKGAIPFAGYLIPKLNFEVVIEYVHATRYYQNKGTGDIKYIYDPPIDSVANKNILLLDDILDEGITILNIKKKMIELDAKAVLTAVLFDKKLNKKKPISADFVGLLVPNKYVFGFGLDFKGQGRNLPHLYSFNES